MNLEKTSSYHLSNPIFHQSLRPVSAYLISIITFHRPIFTGDFKKNTQKTFWMKQKILSEYIRLGLNMNNGHEQIGA